ncbi:hypothetical protein [uncultured Pseudokineococcus sp.]|uniref:hypothetical protein n=1 Tax=uncultured Pseudokineococcus sp. TaxID=1642928 RepID=UPI00262630D7|nr:hypothetical protein [uncultured Pseudokineococcus sp.]
MSENETADGRGTDEALPEQPERGRGPAIPTVSVNAAEQDPDPSETSSDSTARHDRADYDNDREDLPGGRSQG